LQQSGFRRVIITVQLTGSKEDAQDIIQEVFAALWRRRKELNLTGPLAAYLRTRRQRPPCRIQKIASAP